MDLVSDECKVVKSESESSKGCNHTNRKLYMLRPMKNKKVWCLATKKPRHVKSISLSTVVWENTWVKDSIWNYWNGFTMNVYLSFLSSSKMLAKICYYKFLLAIWSCYFWIEIDTEYYPEKKSQSLNRTVKKDCFDYILTEENILLKCWQWIF